jgi:acyl carrier protein/NAD(P)-dependent dehydrogenase (short-subunit alcohol dehydrogenase family)
MDASKTGAGQVSGQVLHKVVEQSLNRDELSAILIRIVSERTGYPEDMIGLDQDLDADLGIDSIKWVEILGTLQDDYLHVDADKIQEVMGELTQINTLKGIVDWIEDNLTASAPTAFDVSNADPVSEDLMDSEALNQEPLSNPETRPPSRYILETVSRSSPGRNPSLPPIPGSIILITDDGIGCARALASKLRSQGHRAVIIQAGKKVKKGRKGVYTADFNDEQSLLSLIKLMHNKEGNIAGVIHLLPLRHKPRLGEISFEEWRNLLQQEVKSIFSLAKGLSADLKNASRSGAGWLFAATGMGGRFAVSSPQTEKSFFPGIGGVVGLIKSLAVEWPTVCCRSIDFNLENLSPSQIANSIIQELGSPNDDIEIGYDGTERLTLSLKPAPLPHSGDRALNIDPNWVIMLTGGARGITAEFGKYIARLAKRCEHPIRSQPPGRLKTHYRGFCRTGKCRIISK